MGRLHRVRRREADTRDTRFGGWERREGERDFGIGGVGEFDGGVGGGRQRARGGRRPALGCMQHARAMNEDKLRCQSAPSLSYDNNLSFVQFPPIVYSRP